MWLTLSVFVLSVVPTALLVWNVTLLRPAPATANRQRRVSVLIPARNEQQNIAALLDSILIDSDTGLEVIVLDDRSSDATADIVYARCAVDSRVRLINGREPPPDVYGKPFACAQLAASATGEILIFVDADVRLAPNAVSILAQQLADSRAPMISGVPRQVTGSFAEWLVVPLIHYVMLAYLPIARMRVDLNPGLGAACGQLIVVERDVYQKVGGHMAIAERIHDGIALARRFRECGYLTDIVDVSSSATCRMYRSTAELIRGFAKNAHEGLGSLRSIVPWTVLLLGGHCAPLVIAAASRGPGVTFLLATAALAASIAGRMLISLRFRQSLGSALLHPAGIAALVAIQWYALFRRLTRKPLEWKGRPV